MNESLETSEDMAQPYVSTAVPCDTHVNPIQRAVQLLREGAAEIARSVSIDDIPDWANESDSKVAHDEALMIARHLEALSIEPQPVNYTPGEWFDAWTVDLMEAFFRSRLPAIREAAKKHGFAIGVHGSLRRDLDLIAAPWREGASDADTLAGAIQRAACGFENEKFQWEQKPCGRVAVSLPICWTHRHGVLSDGHIDLSVCAALVSETPQAVLKHA